MHSGVGITAHCTWLPSRNTCHIRLLFSLPCPCLCAASYNTPFFISDMLYFYPVSSPLLKILGDNKTQKLGKYNLLFSFPLLWTDSFQFFFFFYIMSLHEGEWIWSVLVTLSTFILLWTKVSAWEWIRHLKNTISNCWVSVMLKTALE